MNNDSFLVSNLIYNSKFKFLDLSQILLKIHLNVIWNKRHVTSFVSQGTKNSLNGNYLQTYLLLLPKVANGAQLKH